MSNISKSLRRGMREALQYSSGNQQGSRTHRVQVPKQVDVKEIRSQLQLSRGEFSEKFGFSTRTLEKWEQGLRNPDTAARAYLTVIAYNANIVNQALHNAEIRSSSLRQERNVGDVAK